VCVCELQSCERLKLCKTKFCGKNQRFAAFGFPTIIQIGAYRNKEVMSYYNNQGGSGGGGGYYGGGQHQQQQHQPPPYGGGQQQQQHGINFQQSYNDPNAWQQQPSQPQQYSQQQPSYSHEQTYGQPSQQQQYPQPTSQNAAAAAPFWNPATAANLAALAFSTATSAASTTPDGMLDLAGVAGKSFLENSSARMIPGLERAMQTLRCYFAVDNRYVVQKIKRILLPFTCHQWKRQVRKYAKMILPFCLWIGSISLYLRDDHSVREYL
jgi:hypothetical protein